MTNVSRCPHLPLCRTQRAYVGGRASETENNRDRDDTSPSIRRGLDHATLHRGGYRTATWSAPHGRRGSFRLQSTRQRSPRCPNTAGQPNTACLASTTGHGLPPWRVLAQLGSVSSTPPDCCHGVRVRGSCPTQAALGAPPIGCLVMGDGTPRYGVEGTTRGSLDGDSPRGLCWPPGIQRGGGLAVVGTRRGWSRLSRECPVGPSAQLTLRRVAEHESVHSREIFSPDPQSEVVAESWGFATDGRAHRLIVCHRRRLHPSPPASTPPPHLHRAQTSLW